MMADRFKMKDLRDRKKKQSKKKPGRKPVGRSKPAKDRAAKLAELGATSAQIAAGMGISESTFYRLMHFDPALAQLIREKKQEADERVVTALYARAIGYETSEDTYERSKGEMVLTKRIPKHIPPDPKAAATWLFNRQPNEWKQRQVFEAGDGSPLAPVFVVPAINGAVSLPAIPPPAHPPKK